MKKQETIEKRFLKVEHQWEESRDRKILNLEKQKESLLGKKVRIERELQQIETAIRSLQEKESPKAPSFEVRSLQSHSAVTSSQASPVSPLEPSSVFHQRK